jgi:thiamine biosynthesis protein ThiS
MSETVQGTPEHFRQWPRTSAGRRGTTTLGELAASCGLDARRLLVELNHQTLFAGGMARRTLQHGDRVEFIRVVAGG